MALEQLEATLQTQWRLGQSLLCWAFDPNGLLTVVVPHYFLGNFTAPDERLPEPLANEAYVRELLSGSRQKRHAEIFEIAARLGVAPSFIKLNHALGDDDETISEIDALVKRFSIAHVEERAVALFDIVDFSLFRPFEQASQLNSLSYSMNSAYSKLKREGVEVNFARTTTGDGYYVWNCDLGAFPNVDLLTFFLLVLIDNAVARQKSVADSSLCVSEAITSYRGPRSLATLSMFPFSLSPPICSTESEEQSARRVLTLRAK